MSRIGGLANKPLVFAECVRFYSTTQTAQTSFEVLLNLAAAPIQLQKSFRIDLRSVLI
jgi:hypothetical protein